MAERTYLELPPMTKLSVSDTAAITSKDKKEPTTFLDIPAELRNRIYRLALCAKLEKGDYLDIHTMNTPARYVMYLKASCSDSFLHTDYQLKPNIIATCKQIQREATSILYGENKFSMSPVTFLELKERISAFPANIRFLKLCLTKEETFALSRSWEYGHTSANSYNVGEAFEAVESLRKLRVLELELIINPNDDGAQYLAENLCSVTKAVMEIKKSQEEGEIKVRDAVKLLFQPVKVDMSRYEDMKTRAEQIAESVYGKLTAALE